MRSTSGNRRGAGTRRVTRTQPVLRPQHVRLEARIEIDGELSATTEWLDEREECSLDVRRVLQDAEAVDEVEDARLEGQMVDVALDDGQTLVGRKVREARVHGAGVVHRDDVGAGAERDFRKSSGAAADVENRSARQILRPPSRLPEEAIAGDAEARLAVELRAAELVPLKAERARVVLGRHEPGDGAGNGVGLTAVGTRQGAGLDLTISACGSRELERAVALGAAQPAKRVGSHARIIRR